jgi:molecular chaperone DnaJ
MPTDYYALLGVDKNADKATIKSAYRKQALKYHPDRNPGDSEAEETFKQLNEAYAVLSDDQKRAQYDRYGTTGGPGGGMGGGMGADFSGDIFDIFNSVFGGGFAGGGGSVARGQPGEDLETTARITLEEARDGATIQVTLDRMRRCDRCEGLRAEPGSDGRRTCGTCGGAGQVRQQANSIFGAVMTTRPCPECRGAGEVVTTPCSACSGRGRSLTTDTIDVALPVGIDGGYRIRLNGEGNGGIDGGPDGDLFVGLELEPHEHFTRDGDDLRYLLEIGPAQAALGATVEVPTLDGTTELAVPPGTQPGKVIRLNGKGMPRLRRSGSGDELVTVQVVIPDHLSAKAKEHLLAYAEEAGETVHETHGLMDRLKGVFSRKTSSD